MLIVRVTFVKTCSLACQLQTLHIHTAYRYIQPHLLHPCNTYYSIVVRSQFSPRFSLTFPRNFTYLCLFLPSYSVYILYKSPQSLTLRFKLFTPHNKKNKKFNFFNHQSIKIQSFQHPSNFLNTHYKKIQWVYYFL